MGPQSNWWSDSENAGRMTGVIIFLILAGLFLNWLSGYLRGLEADLGYDPGARFFEIIRPYGIFLSLFFATGIVYSYLRLSQVKRNEERRFEEDRLAALAQQEAVLKNAKWARVLAHMESESQNDWRLAILEADVMLDELVGVLGYDGDTLGEKLKAAPRGEFTTIDRAWDAHRLRNRIAHEGADFVLTEHDARVAIRHYEAVFREFQLI